VSCLGVKSYSRVLVDFRQVTPKQGGVDLLATGENVYKQCAQVATGHVNTATDSRTTQNSLSRSGQQQQQACCEKAVVLTANLVAAEAMSANQMT